MLYTRSALDYSSNHFALRIDNVLGEAVSRGLVRASERLPRAHLFDTGHSENLVEVSQREGLLPRVAVSDNEAAVGRESDWVQEALIEGYGGAVEQKSHRDRQPTTNAADAPAVDQTDGEAREKTHSSRPSPSLAECCGPPTLESLFPATNKSRGGTAIHNMTAEI